MKILTSLLQKMVSKAIPVEEVNQKPVNSLENKLKNLITTYGSTKSQADELKALIEADNKEIKRICRELSINNMETNGWAMSYVVAVKHIVDEERMLEILKEYWIANNGSKECPYIKTKEYVDQDALEHAIFVGDIEDKAVLLKLKECYTDKQEERLTIKRAKEKK